jgi:hypothetical protein
LIGGGDIHVAGVAKGAADVEVFGAELEAELVEVDDGGEAGAIAHEEAPLAVEDVATGAGDEDTALVLDFLLFAVDIGAEELAVGEAAGEHEQGERDEKVEQEDARVGALVGLHEPARAVGDEVSHG